MAKIRGGGYIRSRKSFQCEDCKEWFRLKETYRHHRCIAKEKFILNKKIKAIK